MTRKAAAAMEKCSSAGVIHERHTVDRHTIVIATSSRARAADVGRSARRDARTLAESWHISVVAPAARALGCGRARRLPWEPLPSRRRMTVTVRGGCGTSRRSRVSTTRSAVGSAGSWRLTITSRRCRPPPWRAGAGWRNGWTAAPVHARNLAPHCCRESGELLSVRQSCPRLNRVENPSMVRR